MSTYSASTLSASAPSAHLRFDGVSKSFGARRVLTDISFAVAAGSRVGLIGENGSGKSTLLRIAAGLVEPDAGSVAAIMPGGLTPRIGLLHQEPPFAPTDTIQAAIHTAIQPVRSAISRLDDVAGLLAAHPNDEAAAADYALALDAVECLDGWVIDSRIEQVLSGLGIAEIPRDRETGALSGGQRARLSLSWLLLNAPDVLLLDEPTNHLDDSASDFLTRLLTAWPGPALFASHDRAFLDEVTTALIDLDPAPQPRSLADPLVQDGTGSAIGVTRFTGSYSDYLAARRAQRLRWEERYAAEQSELRRLRAAVGTSQIVGHEEWKPRSETRMAQKFYADRNARVVARRVNDARTRFEVLSKSQIAAPPAELNFAGIGPPVGGAEVPGGVEVPVDRVDAQSGGAPPPVFVAEGAAVSGRLAPLSLTVRAGERLLVTGVNGAGKSTLLRALDGQQRLDAGTISRAAGYRVGLLDQEIRFADPHGLGAARTVMETYIDGVGRELAERIPLQQFGLIAARDEAQQVGSLSTGQQRRLALAILIADPPHVLLLDEPTNHLSLALADALERAVAQFPGTVIVASHDRWLRRRWEGDRLELQPHNSGPFEHSSKRK
ncbi:ABC-F family ATP-binding cassette domain-containing protein [Leucobacter sp. BZR 635]